MGAFPFFWLFLPTHQHAALKQDYDVNKTFRVDFMSVPAESYALREK